MLSQNLHGYCTNALHVLQRLLLYYSRGEAMKRKLTFESLTYSLHHIDYKLVFDERQYSFRCDGIRVLMSQMAGMLDMNVHEMRGYVRGLREMRRLVRRNMKRLEHGQWFCGAQRQEQLANEPQTEKLRGYIQALKDMEKQLTEH